MGKITKEHTNTELTDGQGRAIESFTDEQRESIRHFKVVDYDILYSSGSDREQVWMPIA